MQKDRIREDILEVAVAAGSAALAAGLKAKSAEAQMATPTSSGLLSTPTPNASRATETAVAAAPSPTIFRIPTAAPNASVTRGPDVDVRTTPLPTPTVEPHVFVPSPTVFVIPTARPDMSVTPGPNVLQNAILTPTVTRHEATVVVQQLPSPSATREYPTPAFQYIYPQPTVTRAATEVPEAGETLALPTAVSSRTPRPVSTPPQVGAEGYGQVMVKTDHADPLVLGAVTLTAGLAFLARKFVPRFSVRHIFHRRNHV